MKKFLNAYPDFIIGTLALVFIAVLVVLYLWASGDIFTQINRALAPPVAQSAQGFNLSAASKLNMRGLVVSAPSSTGY